MDKLLFKIRGYVVGMFFMVLIYVMTILIVLVDSYLLSV